MSEPNFIVTARKWRPQTFAEVVGQEHITTTIKNAFINKRIAHAYLLTGPRGCGKTTTARILAKALNCLEPANGEPCNKCKMCESFSNSQTLDIIEMDGASNRGIEEIRTLRESVKYSPTKSNYKVYIIDEVHMLTKEAFNALLKTLEEPPQHTIFIFATTDIHKVPLTIISRCQRFDFRRIEIAPMKEHLKKIALKEGIEIDDLALSLIAKKADGALRDAQSLFDQVIAFSGNKVDSEELSVMFNLIDEEVYFAISNAILEKNFASAFDVSQKIYENGWNFIDFLNGLTEHFRNTLTVIIRNDVSLIEGADIFKQKYLSYSGKFSEGDLLRILSFINKTAYEIKTSSNQKLKLEVALVHLIGLERSSTISELLSKIEKSDFKVSFNSSSVSEPKTKISYHSKAPIKNIEPVNTEIILPTVKSFVVPQVKDESDLSNVIEQWKNFVDQVKTEKVFFGSVLVNSNPVNFLSDQIHLEVDHPEDEDIIKTNESYLDTKTKEVFGKKLKINVSKKKASSKKNSIELTNQTNQLEDSSLAQAIIKELGGKEIKKL
ncbi:MAG: DNA polymerase III subunit tau [Ignavibacteria bacterium]|nr:MAG: DNA polymerase III subunit tau [Ignavibacteria bacterium]KAF0160550.1 MAG: DNA polymerase III subunit tau [Ignavibacteria bacterium]